MQRTYSNQRSTYIGSLSHILQMFAISLLVAFIGTFVGSLFLPQIPKNAQRSNHPLVAFFDLKQIISLKYVF